MVVQSDLLVHSFKEWAIAISALATGDTILLLRKGGIREDSKQFLIKHHHIWLYPTYEHQKPSLLKSQYSDRVKEVPSGWHPQEIEIQSYAEITHTLPIDSLEVLDRLEPYHIWQQEMVCDRFKWKPQQPLTLLLLKVSNLLAPVTIPFASSYGGCKSWIDLQQPISTQGLIPVFSEDVYQEKVTEILNLVNQ